MMMKIMKYNINPKKLQQPIILILIKKNFNRKVSNYRMIIKIIILNIKTHLKNMKNKKKLTRATTKINNRLKFLIQDRKYM